MSSITPFMPARGQNKVVTATTTSASTAVGSNNHAIRVVNSGTVLGYFTTYKASDETRVCTNTETPVPAGSSLTIEKPFDHDMVSYLSDSTTTVMHFQPGEAST